MTGVPPGGEHEPGDSGDSAPFICAPGGGCRASNPLAGPAPPGCSLTGIFSTGIFFTAGIVFFGAAGAALLFLGTAAGAPLLLAAAFFFLGMSGGPPPRAPGASRWRDCDSAATPLSPFGRCFSRHGVGTSAK